MRDFDRRPYSDDEKRIAALFAERGLGGGDDPVEFILSSYAYLVAERNELRKALQECAAEWKSGPGSVIDCFNEARTEFMRRMEVASAALASAEEAFGK